MNICCLSVRQPFAWAIVHGHKELENRTWLAGFRGRLLIHAGQTWGRQEKQDLAMLRVRFPEIAFPEKFDLGGIVGEVMMRGMIRPGEGWETGPDFPTGTETHEGQPIDARWWTGGIAFVFRQAKVLPFIPMRGTTGFFPVDEAVLLHPGTPAPDAKFRPDDRERIL